MNFEPAREAMVEKLCQRGVSDPAVLAACRKVPREKFIDANLREFAYGDHPLPIGEDQTITQPYIVALMTQAIELKADDRVLEVGTGSGYAAAVMAEIAAQVFTIERYASLAQVAQQRLKKLGYTNIRLRHGDGTLGWPEEAPFDAIVVAAGGPSVPQEMMQQLKIGGRLLMPVGGVRDQELIRIERTDSHTFEQKNLGRVRCVPLVGERGWAEITPADQGAALTALIRQEAEEFTSIDQFQPDRWLKRVGDARVVLLGEASHGTAEFYRMRARLTRELIERKGFTLVAVEADWPDARLVDNYVQGHSSNLTEWAQHSRFPQWMWRNREVVEFVDWLRQHNQHLQSGNGKVGFYGLDLYSLQASISSVLEWLDDRFPEAAQVARHRYACLTPWQSDPAAYGHAVLTKAYRKCEPAVVERLLVQLAQRSTHRFNGKKAYLDALVNSRVVSNAEHYYRVMYYGSAESWNLRDQHMFDVLQTLLGDTPGAKAVVWEHNSHLGDARATEMSIRGERNLGQLARQAWSNKVYSVGFGTHSGKVAAATRWGGEMEIKTVRPSHERSFERLFHETGMKRFSLPLRQASTELREQLSHPRLQRAIGVIYRPETELASHYFHADLSRQFDEYIWFDETTPVGPLSNRHDLGPPETYPFGL
ncbi:protein-L-isoaspartate(D-aspartate) O-methyltransferase [bacterium]|nr:protein-L-isoaspartate(D-aspartate) O-methyltransferase [bacterium]